MKSATATQTQQHSLALNQRAEVERLIAPPLSLELRSTAEFSCGENATFMFLLFRAAAATKLAAFFLATRDELFLFAFDAYLLLGLDGRLQRLAGVDDGFTTKKKEKFQVEKRKVNSSIMKITSAQEKSHNWKTTEKFFTQFSTVTRWNSKE